MGKSEVIGHRVAVERFSPPASLPGALLLSGPESVGKYHLACQLARAHARGANALLLRPLTAEGAREARRFVSLVPFGPEGSLKTVAICLDGASLTAQNALLKELEEPPPYARFVLACSGLALPTIGSRCEIMPLGLLTPDEAAAVVRLVRGCGPAEARRCAAVGGGRVAPALEAADSYSYGKAKAAVADFARSVATRDRELMERALQHWGRDENRLLWEWLSYVATGRPTPLFGASDQYGVTKRQARRAILLLSRAGGSRPHIAIRAVADDLMAVT